MALFLFNRAARGEPETTPPVVVEVVLPDCPQAALDNGPLLTALQLELAHDGVWRVIVTRERGDATFTTIEITMRCTLDATSVRIRVLDGDRVGADRTMDISDLPRRLRARVVALAAAELARTRWFHAEAPTIGSSPQATPAAQQVDSPTTIPPPVGPPPILPLTTNAATAETPWTTPPVAPEPTQTPPPSERVGIAVGAATRIFFPDPTWVLGGRAEVGINRFRTGVDVMTGQRSDILGVAQLGLAAAWAAVDLVVWKGDGWRVALGPRVAAGIAWATPTTAATNVGVAEHAVEPYGEASWSATTSFRLVAGWTARAAVEIGGARGLAATADGRPLGRIGGGAAGVCMLVGHAL